MAVGERIAATLEDRQVARWERLGGPGPATRWCFHRPWIVTVGVAAVLTVVLGVAFGVPPFSPLVLVLMFVAPIQPLLRIQRRAHDRWQARGDEPPGPTDSGAPGPAEPG